MPLEQVPDLFPPRAAESLAQEIPSTPDRGRVLALRRSAVLDTGRRKIVYRKRPDGAYELVDVQLGPLAEGTDDAGETVVYFPVLKGLSEGDEVVVQGGFLLDSQRQIEGMPSLLYAEGRSAASLHAGHGAPAPPVPAEEPPTKDSGGEHKH
jgi:hypothetical protein